MEPVLQFQMGITKYNSITAMSILILWCIAETGPVASVEILKGGSTNTLYYKNQVITVAEALTL